jgi:hypothetical protein
MAIMACTAQVREKVTFWYDSNFKTIHVPDFKQLPGLEDTYKYTYQIHDTQCITHTQKYAELRIKCAFSLKLFRANQGCILRIMCMRIMMRLFCLMCCTFFSVGPTAFASL